MARKRNAKRQGTDGPEQFLAATLIATTPIEETIMANVTLSKNPPPKNSENADIADRLGGVPA